MTEQYILSRLCQRFTKQYGAEFCHIAFSPEEQASSSDVGTSSSDGEQRFSNNNDASVYAIQAAATGNPLMEAHDGERSVGHGLVNAAQRFDATKPLVRFDFYDKPQTPSVSPLGSMFLAFPRSRNLSSAQVSGLFFSTEIVAALVARFRSSANQHVNGLTRQQAEEEHPAIYSMPFLKAKKQWIDSFERGYLEQLLAAHNGNISKVARAAGISRYTVYALLNKFQISAKAFKKRKPKSDKTDGHDNPFHAQLPSMSSLAERAIL